MANPELRQELLDDGMEGLTQLPHVVHEAEESPERADEIVRVRDALRELLEEGEIVIFRSHWKELENPVRLSTEDATAVLSDPYWFSFHLNEEPEDRLQFINVKNLVDGPPQPGDRLS